MTRFARAKGSKASNERVKEEATPWHIMKQQLNESLAKEKSFETKGKTKTAKQLLEEKEESSPVTNDWAEFDKPTKKTKKTKLSTSNKIEKPTEKKIKKKKIKEALNNQTEDNNTNLVNDISEKVKRKQIVTDKNKEEENNILKIKSVSVSPQKNKKKRDKIDTSEDAVSEQKEKKIKIDEKSDENSTIEKPTEKLSKRQKRNLKNKNKKSETTNTDLKKSVFDTKENDWNTEVKFGKPDKKLEENSNFPNQNNRFERNRANMKNHHLRKPKVRDNKEHQRRKPMQSMKLMINGMEIEVVMYDGFPVQKEDAERLKELKQQMILKGSFYF